MLTKRQKQVLDFIKSYTRKKGYSPSLEEIKKHLRLSSVSTAHFHVSKLKKAGLIKKLRNAPRAIEVREEKRDEMVSIPLLGTIAAGQPIGVYENREMIQIPKSQIPKQGELFALQVRGNSMINDGVFDGDTVVVRKQPTAENGETVVALINNDEATLKKFYREKNRFRLQPANPSFKPIFTKELDIQGKVVKVLRNFEKNNCDKEIKELTDATIQYMDETDIKHRKLLGQFFTPKSVREKLLNNLPNTIEGPKVLDPACGTGEFLTTAKDYFKKPKLYGWDLEQKLIEITKKTVPGAELKCVDTLLSEESDQYDFIIGNPPYFEFTPPKNIFKKYQEIIGGRVNIFSLFIYQGIKLLKKGGYLAFVVPPSMNNGAYFMKLRKFIVDNANIEYLHRLDDPKIFKGALQSIMLIILKKDKNKGDYIFEKNGITIFSEKAEYLKKEFAKNNLTLLDLGYNVKTGKIVWNKNRNLLTNKKSDGVPLIWAHNITTDGLKMITSNIKKPQYIKIKNYDTGPAVVVNRISGSVGSANLRAAVIPARMKFVAENHVNVIFPPSNRTQTKIDPPPRSKTSTINLTLRDIANQISSKEKLEIVKNITGNTQVSKTELEKLFPLDIKRLSGFAV